MKLRHLVIHNIASIEDAELDFDRGPLASEPLFLITGETGSGKTTILNAICLALYEKVPALTTIGSAEVDREGLKTDSPGQLMRKGTGECFVELSFTGNDGREYLAKWSLMRARRKPTGRFQKTEHTLTDIQKGTSLTRKREIDERIFEITGLTFEQFTRTTMLAQGQFSAFMKAKDNDKSDILEKLTGTEIYARVGAKIYQLYRAKEQETECVEAEIRGANLLSEERKAELRNREQELSALAKALEIQINALDVRLNWLQHSLELQRQREVLEEARKAAQAKIASPDYLEHKTTVDRWDATTQLRQAVKDAQSSQKRLAQLAEAMEALGRERYRRVLDALEWLERERLKLISECESVRDAVKAHEPYAAVYANAQRIEQMAATVRSRLSEKQGYMDKHRQNTNDAEASAKAEEPLSKALAAATAKWQKQAEVAAEAEKAKQGFDLDSITERYGTLDSELTQLQKAVMAVEAYRSALQTKDEAAKALAETQGWVKADTETLATLDALLPHLREESVRAEAFLAGQMELHDHIASLRQRFAEAHECPLCGSTDRKPHSDEVVEEHLSAAKAKADSAREDLGNAEKERARIETALGVHRSQTADRQSTLSAAETKLAKAERAASALLPDYADAAVLEKLAVRKGQLESAKAEATQTLKQAQEVAKTYDKALKTLDELRVAKDEAKDALEQARRNTESLRQAAKTALESAGVSAAAAEAEVAAIAKVLEDNSDRFGAVTAASATALAENIASQAAVYEKDKQALADHEKALTDLSAKISKAQADTQALKKRFGDEYTAIPLQMANIEDVILELNAEVNRLDGETEAERTKNTNAEDEIAKELQSTGFERALIEQLAALAPEQVAKWRGEVQEASQALTRAVDQIDVVDGQILQHQQSKPEIADDDSVDTFTVAKAQAVHDKDLATAEKAQCATLLQHDSENAAKQAANRLKLEKLRLERDNWAELNAAFGQKDGALFKRIAQSYLLGILLNKANYYLAMLSGRYRLSCEDRSLTIDVVDLRHGNSVRNVGLLSGGESFVVSLALALGLSALSKEKISIDTLFIDEGFGSLDGNTLETVISTLDRLHSLGGRRIGIISHVEALKARIPVQIVLTPTGPSSSALHIQTR